MATRVEVGRGTVDRERVAGLVERTLRAERREPAAISVSFVDPETSRRLNRSHRGADRPTDVLSFPFDAAFPQGDGGEVIVCPEVAAVDAAEHDRPVEDAIDRLVVHGVLHLLGYEDDTDDGLRRMETRTDQVLREMRG